MTSTFKTTANRANAQNSTGPKTAHGKISSARNARRHGLSLSILADPTRSAEVEALAREIAGEEAIPEIFEGACRIAEAQIDLQRVRQARRDLLTRHLSNSVWIPKVYFTALKRLGNVVARHARQFGPMAECPAEIEMEVMNIIEDKPPGARKFSFILSDYTKELVLMDRYERRALSRRKFAIRAFDAARRQAAA
jgi:hypothetical protein